MEFIGIFSVLVFVTLSLNQLTTIADPWFCIKSFLSTYLGGFILMTYALGLVTTFLPSLDSLERTLNKLQSVLFPPPLPTESEDFTACCDSDWEDLQLIIAESLQDQRTIACTSSNLWGKIGDVTKDIFSNVVSALKDIAREIDYGLQSIEESIGGRAGKVVKYMATAIGACFAIIFVGPIIARIFAAKVVGGVVSCAGLILLVLLSKMVGIEWTYIMNKNSKVLLHKMISNCNDGMAYLDSYKKWLNGNANCYFDNGKILIFMGWVSSGLALTIVAYFEVSVCGFGFLFSMLTWTYIFTFVKILFERDEKAGWTWRMKKNYVSGVAVLDKVCSGLCDGHDISESLRDLLKAVIKLQEFLSRVESLGIKLGAYGFLSDVKDTLQQFLETVVKLKEGSDFVLDQAHSRLEVKKLTIWKTYKDYRDWVQGGVDYVSSTFIKYSSPSFKEFFIGARNIVIFWLGIGLILAALKWTIFQVLFVVAIIYLLNLTLKMWETYYNQFGNWIIETIDCMRESMFDNKTYFTEQLESV